MCFLKSLCQRLPFDSIDWVRVIRLSFQSHNRLNVVARLCAMKCACVFGSGILSTCCFRCDAEPSAGKTLMWTEAESKQRYAREKSKMPRKSNCYSITNSREYSPRWQKQHEQIIFFTLIDQFLLFLGTGNSDGTEWICFGLMCRAVMYLFHLEYRM